MPSRRCRARTAGRRLRRSAGTSAGSPGTLAGPGPGRGAAAAEAEAGSSSEQDHQRQPDRHHRAAIAAPSAPAARSCWVIGCGGSCAHAPGRRFAPPPARCAPRRCVAASAKSSGSNMPVGRRVVGQLVEGMVAVAAVAAFERAVGVEQDRHVVVGVVAKPDRQAGRGVLAQVLPRPPQRLQAGDGLGVTPPLRTPHALVPEDRAAIHREQPLLHPLVEGQVVEAGRVGELGELPLRRLARRAARSGWLSSSPLARRSSALRVTDAMCCSSTLRTVCSTSGPAPASGSAAGGLPLLRPVSSTGLLRRLGGVAARRGRRAGHRSRSTRGSAAACRVFHQ